jgi:hypothetical protein
MNEMYVERRVMEMQAQQARYLDRAHKAARPRLRLFRSRPARHGE